MSTSSELRQLKYELARELDGWRVFELKYSCICYWCGTRMRKGERQRSRWWMSKFQGAHASCLNHARRNPWRPDKVYKRKPLPQFVHVSRGS